MPGPSSGLTLTRLPPAAQMSPIQQGLKDAHPYVRRTAVMGVLKVYHLDSAAVLNAGALAQPRHSTNLCSGEQQLTLPLYRHCKDAAGFMLWKCRACG